MTLFDEEHEIPDDVEFYIGKPVWQVVSQNGDDNVLPEIRQSFVDMMDEDGTFGIYKEKYGSKIHTDKKEAIDEYHNKVEGIIEKYKRELQDLEAHKESITDETIEEEIQESLDELQTNSVYAKVDLDNFPEIKFAVGQTVYIILSDENTTMNGETFDGVLKIEKTTVSGVRLYTSYRSTPDIVYSFDTAWSVTNDLVFATLEDAKMERKRLIEEQLQSLKNMLEETVVPKEAYTNKQCLEKVIDQITLRK